MAARIFEAGLGVGPMGTLTRFITVLVSVLAVACQAPSPLPTVAPTVTAATTPGVREGAALAQASPAARSRLAVYSALNASLTSELVDAFAQASPGQEVEVLPLAAATNLQTRIATEQQAPRADIFLGGPSEAHEALGTQGLLLPYRSPGAESIDARFKDAAGTWTGWNVGILGLAVNTDRWAKEMVNRPLPTAWDDMLDPLIKGKVGVPDPMKSRAGYAFLATHVLRFDGDEAMALDYMRALNANLAQYVGPSPLGMDPVGQGQFIVAPNWAHEILTAANNGRPATLVVPKQTAIEIGAVSIVKGGPNPAAARAFVDWLLTREAGELSVRLSNRLSVRSDVPLPPGAPSLDAIDVVNEDGAWTSQNRERLLQSWREAVGR